MLFLISITSCTSIAEPTIKHIINLEVLEANRSKVVVEFDMVFDNPNNFALDLAAADIEVITDDIVVAEVHQLYDAMMPAKDEFAMPIHVEMDLKKLYGDNPISAIEKGLKILNDRKLEVMMQGSIKVGKGSVKMAVPIKRQQEFTF